eukprot:gnl/TRDRNA2_/TRDRNA2_201126_c0_seq1.p1 gnl/TRDRNA2_/TRDRNA2_201126_c0~~gnl/TRDRNA2_/TRDRNA2_201126_c0_seq1.p1  ORF type:complete len:278 (+),score=25.81 gnl/TRDRNA2_/TRDRNA2_201126_c0_seq1:299-1132(+)
MLQLFLLALIFASAFAHSGNASLFTLVSQIQRTRRTFEAEGVIVLRAAFGKDLVDTSRHYIDQVMKEASKTKSYLHHYAYWEPIARHTVHARASASGRRLRLDCVKCLPGPNPLHRIIFDSRMLVVASSLTGRPVKSLGRQSAHIFFRGSQQRLHLDTWYGLAGMRRGGSVSFSFALDDVDNQNGPFIYVPRSHHWPEKNVSELAELQRWRRLKADDEEAEISQYDMLDEFLPSARSLTVRAGDILIWHERLVHGEALVRDHSRMRRSIVTSYGDRY